MSNNNEHKINFLTSAITDAQELIRFIEAKTAIAITIIGAYFVTFISFFPSVVENYTFLSFWFCLWQIVFLIVSALTIHIMLRVIMPSNNPVYNLNITPEEIPSITYYLGANKYQNWTGLFRNSHKSKLAIKHHDCYNSILSADDYQVINSLSFELEKVSFIRNLKSDRFKLMIKMLLVNTIAFCISFCFITIELNNAKNKKARLKIKNQKLSKLTLHQSKTQSIHGTFCLHKL